MYEVILDNELIRLRKANINDAEGILKLLNDPDVMLYYGESEKTYEYAKKEVAWFNQLFNSKAGRWVIEDKKTGQYIGDIGLHNYHSNDRKGEIGYKLDKKYWSKGITSKCVEAVLKIAFESYDYNRVEALVDVRNIPCIQVLKKNNFTKEGLLRDYEFEHGNFVDLEIHSILKREYI